jgi:hypothetical protein
MSERPVYVRVRHGDLPGNPGTSRTYLIEIQPNGEIPREVGFDRDGSPTFITRPGDYPISDWPVPPGSPEFEEQFGQAERITPEEFETAYEAADARLD